MAYVDDYTALTTGEYRWNSAAVVGTPTLVTYAFLDTSELPSFSENPAYASDWSNEYRSMTGSQRTAVRRAIDHYENKTGLVFVEVQDPARAQVQFVGNNTDDPALISWAYLPTDIRRGGDVALSSVFVTISYDTARSWSMDFSRGSSGYTVVLHELGHAVGLDHPHDGNINLAPAYDNHDYTLMSYDWSWSGDSTGRTRDNLAPIDLDALHFLYGERSGFTAYWEAGVLYSDGGGGADEIVTGMAPSHMRGGWGHDKLIGAQFADTIIGGTGRDTLDGQGGNDRLIGGPDRDVLRGGGGNDHLTGRAAGDRLLGEGGSDQLYGGSGPDILLGDSGEDRLSGGRGHDTLRGGVGNDQLYGGPRDDHLIGGPDDDRLGGGPGQDKLFGSLGNDTLIGAAGNDQLWGGSGADVFVFGEEPGNDRIRDWTDGVDVISLTRHSDFSSFADLQAAAVQTGDDVLIELGPDSSILILDTRLSLLDADDFIF